MRLAGPVTVLLAGIINAVHGHISIIYPCPRYSAVGKDCPEPPEGETLDGEINSPISSVTLNEYNPICKYTKPWPTPAATWTAGDKVTIEFNPHAVSHSGGHCEFSISYDGGENFVVIEQVLRYCFVVTQPSGPTNDMAKFSYDIQLPDDLPASDKAIFSWTWVNASGNREFYMNCADIEIKGSSSEFTGKQMTIVNYKGYPTLPEFGQDYDTGIDLYTTDAKYIKVTSDGGVTDAKGGSGGGSSGGGGGGSNGDEEEEEEDEGKGESSAVDGVEEEEGNDEDGGESKIGSNGKGGGGSNENKNENGNSEPNDPEENDPAQEEEEEEEEEEEITPAGNGGDDLPVGDNDDLPADDVCDGDAEVCSGNANGLDEPADTPPPDTSSTSTSSSTSTEESSDEPYIFTDIYGNVVTASATLTTIITDDFGNSYLYTMSQTAAVATTSSSSESISTTATSYGLESSYSSGDTSTDSYGSTTTDSSSLEAESTLESSDSLSEESMSEESPSEESTSEESTSEESMSEESLSEDSPSEESTSEESLLEEDSETTESSESEDETTSEEQLFAGPVLPEEEPELMCEESTTMDLEDIYYDDIYPSYGYLTKQIIMGIHRETTSSTEAEDDDDESETSSGKPESTSEEPSSSESEDESGYVTFEYSSTSTTPTAAPTAAAVPGEEAEES